MILNKRASTLYKAARLMAHSVFKQMTRGQTLFNPENYLNKYL